MPLARIDYLPVFKRYPPAVAQALARIGEARGGIDGAAILPAQEKILRRDALVGSIHYSNAMEGNELSRLEALRAVEHELPARDRAALELVNYVDALNFLETSQRRGEIEYSPAFVKQVHGILTKGLGREDARFKPRHEGEWRDGEAVVSDGIAVYHRGPDADEVDALMAARLAWLERKRDDQAYPVPILAGIAHFELAEVHPFADYNGRTARLIAMAIFYRENFLSRPLFSPERYYAETKEAKDAYYEALRAIKRTHNLDAWLTYYVEGLAHEFERVAQRVRDLTALTRELELPLQLTKSQDAAIAALTAGGHNALTIGEYVDVTGVSPRTASRELNALAEAGVLRARGETRRRRFTLARASSSAAAGGRPRTWTEDRIRRELSALVDETGVWPSYADFRRHRKLALYAAIARTGGPERWAPEIGVPPPEGRTKQD